MKIKNIHKIFFYVFIFYILSIILFNYYGYWDNPPKNQILLDNFLNNRVAIKGEILSAPVFYEKFYKKRIKFILKIYNIENVDLIKNGKIKIFVDCNCSLNYSPRLGDKIKIYGDIQKLEFPNKYNNYLKYQNIYYKLQDNSIGNYLYLGRGNFFRCLFSNIRTFILDKILLLYSGISREILPALIINEKSYISKNTKDFLSSAGLSHIISISGMHIGFIFFCISIFFKNKKNFLFIFLSLTTIWFYSGITGFSPSSIRTCIMLSFIIIANIFDKQTFTLNNLILTCFFMLVINPRQLFMISFLFSFLGVFSIFYFYNFWKNVIFGFLNKKYIYQKESSFNYKKIFKYPFDILKEVFFVTLAAQMFLSPFVVFYFNSLNFSSLLFNLVVVPFVSLIMIISFVSIFFAYLYMPFAKLFAFLNQYLISKVFGFTYFLYKRYSVCIHSKIDFFYLIFILCIILVIPQIKNIKKIFVNLKLYLIWIILLIFNILLYAN